MVNDFHLRVFADNEIITTKYVSSNTPFKGKQTQRERERER